MRRLIPALVAALLVMFAAAGFAAYNVVMRPLPVGEEAVRIEVPPGAALSAVAASLHHIALLPNPRLFVWYARLRGDAARIQAGEYEIAPGTTAEGLLDQFVDGRVLLHSLTIIEGWLYQQMMAAIREHPAVKQVLGDAGDVEILAEIGAAESHPEGLFFPDTYRFPKGTTDIEILRRVYEVMHKRVEQAWKGRDGGLPLASSYEALILASIVEKETALASERARIAGVMIRRLERGMRLETDPTVIYGLGADYDGNIRRRDLQTDTPYNTYTRTGLPPTPIALAGADSIEAVMHPEAGEALYFVATGEPDGSHYFSATLDEHNEAVRRYLQRSRQPD